MGKVHTQKGFTRTPKFGVSLQSKRGFTFIEIMIVLGILGLLSAIIFSTFISLRKSQALDKDTEIVAEVLTQARSQTLSSQNASQYGVHIASAGITLFTGSSYIAGAATNQSFSLTATDSIVTISLAGGGSDIVFDRLTGETSQNGSVVISSPSASRVRTITIYRTGLIQF